MASQEVGRTKGFPCKQCNTVLPNMPSLLEHIQTHYLKEERTFRCEQCGRGYRHPGSLANHKKTHRVGSFQCHICARNLSNLLALKNHLRIHTTGKKFPCTQCPKTFRVAAQLDTHLKVHHACETQGTSEKNDIQQAGLSESELQMVPSSSLNDRLMPDLSHDSTTKKDTMVSNDTMNRPFKCDQCKRTYRHHGSLINHKKCHQVGVFDCPVCYKQFSNLAALKSHQRIHKNSKSGALAARLSHLNTAPNLSQPVLKNAEVAAHFCHLCEVAFPNDSDFQDHILLHNTSSLSLGLPAGFSDDLSCDYNVIQSNNVNYSQPSLSDTPLLPSLLDKQEPFDQLLEPARSGQMHIDLNSLKAHYGTHHSPSSSDIQGMSAEFQKHDNDIHLFEAALTNEMKDQDSSAVERRFKCQICNKSYRHAGSLINHKNSHQTGIYQCSICRKHYPHLAALRSHLRIHKSRPPTIPLSAEGDWLSPEPLTLEGHQGDLHTQELDHEDVSMLNLSQNLGELAHTNLDSTNSKGLDEFEVHETLDTALPQHRLKQLTLPQGEPQAERHMCADCGETYADIAGIKSHTCPHLHQQQEALSNGFFYVDIQDPGTKALPELGGIETGSRRHKHDPNQRNYRGPDFHENTFMTSGHEADKDDDEEVYQCSMCGTHYTNMQALRSHFHSHTQTQSTAASTGPSSLSSLEEEEEEEEEDSSEGQEKDGDLIICSTCGESLSKEQDLQEHQLMHNRTIEDETGLNKGADDHCNNGKRDENMICGMCGVACEDYLQLEIHLCSDQGRMESKRNEESNVAGDIESRRSGDYQECPNVENRPHKCDQCGRAYRHAGSLLNHKKSHKTGVFRCFVCQKRFYNLLALKNHQRTHFDVKRHKCEECGKAFKIQKQLLNHLRIHEENRARAQELNWQLQTLMQAKETESNGGPIICNINAKKSSSGSRNSSSRGRGAVVLCKRCGETHSYKKVCPTVGTLVEPQVEVKLEEVGNDCRPYACDQCGRTYRHAGSLVNHKNSHKTGEYCCSVCNNTYSNQLAMKNHLRIHFAVKKHTCHDCGKAFRGQKQLSIHARSHCRKKALTTGGRGEGNRRTKGGKDTKCKECRQAITSTAELLSHTCGMQFASTSAEGHLNGVKNDREPCGSSQADEKVARPFGCNICGRTYRHAGSLLNHKNTHKTGQFNCSFCSKLFSNPMALRNHTRIHTQKKKHVCTTCGKAFRLASILHNHQKMHIRGEMHFNCPICGKSFQGKSGLKRHRCQKNQEGRKKATESRAESGERCFTCEQCGRSYRHAGSLLNHKKTHATGIYHCNICLKTFSNLLALKNHRRIHSEVRRHCCPDCGKTFRVSSHLRSHRRVHRKEQSVSQCTSSQSTFPSFQQHQELHSQAQHIGADFSWGSGLDHSLMQTEGLDPNGVPRLAPSFSCLDNNHPLELQGQQDSHGAEAKGEKVHVCEHCGRTYRHAGSLLNHKNSHKTGCFFCSACQKEFSNLMALKNHRRIHTEPKRFQCTDCGKAFRVSTQLVCHRRIHTKEKPFSCSQCDKHFSSKSNLRHHQKVHQSQQNFEVSLDMSADSLIGLSMSPFL